MTTSRKKIIAQIIERIEMFENKDKHLPISNHIREVEALKRFKQIMIANTFFFDIIEINYRPMVEFFSMYVKDMKIQLVFEDHYTIEFDMFGFPDVKISIYREYKWGNKYFKTIPAFVSELFRYINSYEFPEYAPKITNKDYLLKLKEKGVAFLLR